MMEKLSDKKLEPLTSDQKKQRISELYRLKTIIQGWVKTSDNKDKTSALIGVSMFIHNRIKMLSDDRSGAHQPIVVQATVGNERKS